MRISTLSPTDQSFEEQLAQLNIHINTKAKNPYFTDISTHPIDYKTQELTLIAKDDDICGSLQVEIQEFQDPTTSAKWLENLTLQRPHDKRGRVIEPEEMNKFNPLNNSSARTIGYIQAIESYTLEEELELI